MNKLISMWLLLFAMTTGAQSVQFIDNDWTKARAEAKQQNKYLFVDAYTDWCGWCKVMDKKTFPDKDVAAFMSANFVSSRLEMEHNYGINVAMKYRVRVFPSFLVFSPDGKLVNKFEGYSEPTAFIGKLKESLNPNERPSYAGISENIDLPFPDFYKKAYAGNGRKEWASDTVVNAYLDGQTDLFSEINYGVLTTYSFKLSEKHRNFLLDNRSKYEQLYGKADIELVLGSMGDRLLDEAIKNKNKSDLDVALNFIDKYYPEKKEEAKDVYRMEFYKGTENWSAMADEVDKFIAKKGNEQGDQINEWAWNVYEKCGDARVVERAIGWMKPVIEKKPAYAPMDTYAALLYKDKQLANAKIYALKAIELGKASGEKTASTEELLKKIEGGK